jgi:Fic family protein
MMTYKPIFSISPKLSNLLTDISVIREKILTLKILPRREIKLKQNARLRMIHSSTAIEGNLLGLRDIEAILDGQVVTNTRDRDIVEVVNYEKVMKLIDKLAQTAKNQNWEEDILKVHRLTTAGLLPPSKSGHYRLGPVFVIQRLTGKIMYRGPAASRVPKLMAAFCSWLRNDQTLELSPVIVAAIAHHQFVTIHPFADGNGRTARALATLTLYRRGFDIKRMFALDDYYNLDRQSYYRAIRKAREDKDLTSWLEYFSQGLLLELQQVLEKVEHFNREMKTSKQPVYLSKRQRQILDFVALNGKIFRSDVVDIASVSPKTAYRELEFLRQSELLNRKGKGPAAHYLNPSR